MEEQKHRGETAHDLGVRRKSRNKTSMGKDGEKPDGGSGMAKEKASLKTRDSERVDHMGYRIGAKKSRYAEGGGRAMKGTRNRGDQKRYIQLLSEFMMPNVGDTSADQGADRE